eukprot:5111099-Lingulodinium_polyedra.AAC.1
MAKEQARPGGDKLRPGDVVSNPCLRGDAQRLVWVFAARTLRGRETRPSAMLFKSKGSTTVSLTD